MNDFLFPDMNFPSFEAKVKREGEDTWIWDIIRNKWVILTPEETVRQHLIHYLKNELNYPAGLMQVECGLKVGNVLKRFDLVIMDRALHPWLICECKAPEVKLNQQTLEQAAIYNSVLKCPYLAVTNGIKHFCFSIQYTTGKITAMNRFPDFKE